MSMLIFVHLQYNYKLDQLSNMVHNELEQVFIFFQYNQNLDIVVSLSNRIFEKSGTSNSAF